MRYKQLNPSKTVKKQIGILTKSVSPVRNAKYLLKKFPHKFMFFIFKLNYHVTMSRRMTRLGDAF